MFRGGSAGKISVEGGRSGAARRPYWLVRRSNGGNIESLTVEFDGVEALPVFSFAEEAELFLAFCSAGDGWKVGRSGAGEILSLLHGPLSGAVGVVLDPVPESCGVSLLRLLTIERADFEASVLGPGYAAMNPRKTSLPA